MAREQSAREHRPELAQSESKAYEESKENSETNKEIKGVTRRRDCTQSPGLERAGGLQTVDKALFRR